MVRDQLGGFKMLMTRETSSADDNLRGKLLLYIRCTRIELRAMLWMISIINKPSECQIRLLGWYLTADIMI